MRFIHTAKLRLSLTKGGVAKSVPAAQRINRWVRFGFLDETDDLFFGKSFFHVCIYLNELYLISYLALETGHYRCCLRILRGTFQSAGRDRPGQVSPGPLLTLFFARLTGLAFRL